MITRYNFTSGGFFPADNGMWIRFADLERVLIGHIEISDTQTSQVAKKILEEIKGEKHV